ncbi:hypothetical protein [Rhodococcoides kyotonense]|nr:hypothetical protein [Rhodococcus kyotonensis]
MTNRVRVALVALCAVATMAIGAAPAAAASPLTDFLDSLDLGSSDPTTSPGDMRAPLRVEYLGPLTSNDRVFFEGTSVRCLDVVDVPDRLFDRTTVAEVSARYDYWDSRCESNRGTMRLALVIVGPVYRTAQVDVVLDIDPRGNRLWLDCVDSTRAGFAPLRCSTTGNTVIFS